MLLIIPQTIIFFNSRQILLLLHQDPAVAAAAAQYLKVLSLGLPGYAGFECVRRWLQAQGLMMAPVIALIFAAPLNAVLNWLLVWGPWDAVRLGFVGAPLATAMSMNVMFLVSLVYAVNFAPREAWGGFSKGRFETTWALAKLSRVEPSRADLACACPSQKSSPTWARTSSSASRARP